MVEVHLSNGDWAEAETPEDAVFAATTMIEEAHAAFPVMGQNITASFFVDGKCILYELNLIQLRGMH